MNVCTVCKENTANRRNTMCAKCSSARVMIQRSAAAMMILHGVPRASGMCVECGVKPATHRDHRHYSNPLKVDFVCAWCNVHRGAALDLHELIMAYRNSLLVELVKQKPDDTELLIKLEPGFNLESHLEGLERNILLQALEITGFNRTAAAKLLGVTFRALRYKVIKLNIHITRPHELLERMRP